MFQYVIKTSNHNKSQKCEEIVHSWVIFSNNTKNNVIYLHTGQCDTVNGDTENNENVRFVFMTFVNSIYQIKLFCYTIPALFAFGNEPRKKSHLENEWVDVVFSLDLSFGMQMNHQKDMLNEGVIQENQFTLHLRQK